LFETLGYVFVGLSALAPWVMAAALFFGRQWLVARIEKGVQHGFDSRLEAIRAELRASEERLKSTLRDRENEIALLRNTVLAGSASRQSLLDKRRFEAVERVWTTVNNMAGHFRLLSEFMARMNIDEMAKDVGDPRMKKALSMFSPPDMTKFKNVARDERPFLPELAWAYYSAYSSILFGNLMVFKLLESGVSPNKMLKKDRSKDVLKAALPHQSTWIDDTPPEMYHFLLEELEDRLLSELRNILDGVQADQAAAQKAKDILKAVSLADREVEEAAASAERST